MQLRLEVNLELRFQGKPTSLRLVNLGTSCLRCAVVGNTRETIARFHGSFSVLFSVCLSARTNPERATKRVKQWDRVK